MPQRHVSHRKRARARRKSTIRFRQSLFWDVDPKTIDPEKHARYIIERILDFGDTREVRWARRYYSPQRIRNTLRRSRVVHDKSRALWDLLYR